MNRNLLIGITAFGLVSATTTVSALAVTPHVQTITALQASLNYCTYQTGGQNRTAPAFQQCMATRGYHQSTQYDPQAVGSLVLTSFDPGWGFP